MALPIRKPGQGGGFLNGASGAILDAGFVANKSGENKNGPYTTYSAKLTIQPDGGEAVDQFLDAGFMYGDNTVSEDGKSIEGSDDYYVDAATQYGQFLTSLVEGEGQRFPEETLGDLRSLKPIIGTRVTFKREVDVEATKKRGAYKLGKKAAGATDQQLFEAGKKIAKKGKSAGKAFPLDRLLVTELISLPEVKGKKTAAATKTATKAAPAKAAAPVADTDAVDAALVSILTSAKDSTLARSGLSAAAVKYRLSAKLDPDTFEGIRKQLVSDAYIADAVERELIVVEGAGKSAVLTLVPSE